MLINAKHTYYLPSVFTPLTNKSLSLFQFAANDIKSIINKLDPNKAHGHDMISIRVIKLFGDSIYKPLEMNFKSSLNQRIFPVEWKMYYQCIRMVIINVWKTTNRFLFYQCLAKYLKDSFMTLCLNIFLTTTLFPLANPVSNQVNPALTN